MHRTTRLAPALLLAVAVLLVAVAGTATAAKLITGKDVKNGTLTGLDVKNGSLGSADVKDGSLTRADLRAQSRTSVVGVRDDSTGLDLATCSDTALDDCAALLTIAVVPGTQLVTASGVLDNTNGAVPAISNRCGLVQGGDVLTEARFALAANGQPGELSSFTLQQVVSVPDASLPISLRCTEMPGEALRLNDPRLTSVRTGF